jgi:hypothetical protein
VPIGRFDCTLDGGGDQRPCLPLVHRAASAVGTRRFGFGKQFDRNLRSRRTIRRAESNQRTSLRRAEPTSSH